MPLGASRPGISPTTCPADSWASRRWSPVVYMTVRLKMGGGQWTPREFDAMKLRVREALGRCCGGKPDCDFPRAMNRLFCAVWTCCTVHACSRTFHAVSRRVHAKSTQFHATFTRSSRGFTSSSRKVHTDSRNVHAVSRKVHAVSRTVHAKFTRFH